jgi:hypothetical protein
MNNFRARNREIKRSYAENEPLALAPRQLSIRHVLHMMRESTGGSRRGTIE